MDTIFSADFLNLIIRFIICVVVIWVIVYRFYAAKSKRRDFYFTFMLISIAIFFIVYFMIFALEDMKAKASMGLGIGLFGIFSIMRYRTDAMPVREMTYLFVTICLSVVHAMVDVTSLSEDAIFSELGKLLVIDIIVMLTILFFERKLKVTASKLVQYDRIELIKPEKHDELVADLEERLGVKVIKVEVGGVDFLRDSAVLRVTYDSNKQYDVNKMYEVRKSEWRHM